MKNIRPLCVLLKENSHFREDRPHSPRLLFQNRQMIDFERVNGWYNYSLAESMAESMAESVAESCATYRSAPGRPIPWLILGPEQSHVSCAHRKTSLNPKIIIFWEKKLWKWRKDVFLRSSARPSVRQRFQRLDPPGTQYMPNLKRLQILISNEWFLSKKETDKKEWSRSLVKADTRIPYQGWGFEEWYLSRFITVRSRMEQWFGR